MTSLFKKISIAVFAMFAVVGLAACTPAQPVDMSTVTAVIDVRTAGEYAEGHLEGAVNIDVQSAAFTEEVGKLDKAGTYVVYCRSGNRSKTAIDTMKSIGFTNLINGGGYQDASNMTKLPIVQ